MDRREASSAEADIRGSQLESNYGPAISNHRTSTGGSGTPTCPTGIQKLNTNRPHNATRTTQRGGGFSAAEVGSLLDSVKEVLPVGGLDWDRVLSLHSTRWSSMHRRHDGLRRKFMKLHTTAAPTGDPTISLCIRRAKDTRQEIDDKIDIGEDIDDDLDLNENETTVIPPASTQLHQQPSLNVERLSHLPFTSSPSATEARKGRPISRARRSSANERGGDLIEIIRLQMTQDAL